VGRPVRLSLLLALLPALALAEPVRRRAPAPKPASQPAAKSAPAPEDILPDSAFESDPIGIDESTRGVEAAARRADAEAAAQARADAADAARYGPAPPAVTPIVGEALTSVRSVRERTHRVNVALDAGLARVRVEMLFATPVDKPAEVRYRLAVPAGASLAALEVCNERGCRKGAADRAEGLGVYDDAVQARGPERALPIAHAVAGDDARGRAIVVRAAPVVANEDLTVRVEYVTDAVVRAGLARLVLPARGMDPNAAAAEVHLDAPDMIDARIADAPVTEAPARFDPWVDVPLSARLSPSAPPRATLQSFPCADGGRCARAYAVAAPREAQARDLVLAIDVSPSTQGPARGRLLPAIASLLAAAPDGTRVRAVVFAARARAIVAEPVPASALPLARFGDAGDAKDLGSATRFEAVWGLAHQWFHARTPRRLRPTVVVIGDGGITSGDARPFERARRAGVEVNVLNISDRPTVRTLRDGARATGGAVIDLGRAHGASGANDVARFDERVGAVFAPVVASRVTLAGSGETLGALRAGDSVTWEGRVRSAARLSLGGRPVAGRGVDSALAFALAARVAHAARPENDGVAGPSPALAAVDARDLGTAVREGRPEAPRGKRCDPRGPAFRLGGVSSDRAPVALAEPRACRPTAARTPVPDGGLGAGMPADPLLGMLRQRVIPLARGCFRRDRAGRLDYAVRAVFAFTLAEREVVTARVEGAIAERLRACLLEAVDSLDVPRFTGLVDVRYPLHTEREPTPREIELTPQTASDLDRLIAPDAPSGNVRVIPPPKPRKP
jgi:hypothetical protein